MTFKEFEIDLNNLGLFIKETEDEFFIKTAMCGFEVYVANISKNELCSISTNYKSFHSLEKDTKEKLIRLLLFFSSTPINCRKYKDKVNKYYLKLKLAGLVMQNDQVSYLNKVNDSSSYVRGNYSVGNNIESTIYKTKFTQEEVDEIAEYIVCQFEQILVEDE